LAISLEKEFSMGILLNFTYLDNFGRTGSKEVELNTTDPATAVTDAATVLAAFDALMAGGIRSARLTVPVSYTSTTPDAEANRDTGLTFSCILEGGTGKRGVLKIPAPKTSVIGAGDSVDLTDALVTGVLDLYSGVVKTCLLSDGEQVDVFTEGHLDA